MNHRTPIVGHFTTTLSSDFGWLPVWRQTHTRRKSTWSGFPTPAIEVAENPRAAAMIIEVDSAEAMPECDG